MNEYKTFEQLKKELGNNYDLFMYEINLCLLQKIDKAVEYMEMELGTNREGVFKAFGDLDYAQEEVEKLYRILKGETNE